MKRFCLDTSAYSHFKRGEPDVVELISHATEVLVPVVALGELRAGFRRGRHREVNTRELTAFLRSRIVRVLDVDDEVSSIYADIVNALREAGTPLPTNDIWIASCAASAGATVLTYDEHFSQIARVSSHVLRASS